MPHKHTPEERSIVKLLNQASLQEEQRAQWLNAIETHGFTEEIAEEIRKELTATPGERPDTEAVKHTRLVMEFTQLVKRWRMADQSKHFNRR